MFPSRHAAEKENMVQNQDQPYALQIEALCMFFLIINVFVDKSFYVSVIIFIRH